MASFTVEEVALATGGRIIRLGSKDQQFNGIATDTRNIKPGNLFIALKGERFNGHDFISQAVEKGATGILISEPDRTLPQEVATICIEDTILGLQCLAKFHRQRFQIPLIAVTGSNGKTTTKDMTAAVLSSRFKVLKTEANYNNEIGLPLTLLNLDASHEVAIVEMGMRGTGQIRHLAEIALPTIGIITNIGETHMELLGSMENIAAAKAELVACISPPGFVLLNADNHYVRAMGQITNAKVIEYGIIEPCDFHAKNLQSDGQGTSFDCSTSKWEDITLYVPAVGKHNVYNALAATAIGLELGLTAEEVKQGLAQFTASAMRLSIDKIGDYIIINDAYNASPMSMSAAIDTLMEVAEGRQVVVLGDMLELGKIAVEAHRRIGRKLAECGVPIVVTVGDLARHIAEAAHEYGIKVAIACQSHNQAKEVLQQYIQPGDTILIKGSRGMKMEQMIEMLA